MPIILNFAGLSTDELRAFIGRVERDAQNPDSYYRPMSIKMLPALRALLSDREQREDTSS
jgi:hypothetical protein